MSDARYYKWKTENFFVIINVSLKEGGIVVAETECYCSSCGRKLKSENGILQEDALFVKKNWGYFSRKDLETHEFVLCEDCYDAMVARFAKPVRTMLQNEVLN